MIIMISSQNDSLQGVPSLRFGRAPFFIRYDLEDTAWAAHSNAAVNERGGAGVAASQFAIDQKVDAVLSGSFGPNAARVLSEAGIKMYVFDDTYSSVQAVVDGFVDNLLDEVHH
ncbi:MAG: NifB/NifX family molybdenum-iron cluster-binding protein [Brevefilum sp.]|jgi:predicted Fe-Mo cluster-binding NifX family protein